MAMHVGRLAVVAIAGVLGSTLAVLPPAQAGSRNIGSILGAMGGMLPTQQPTNTPNKKAVANSKNRTGTPSTSSMQANKLKFPSGSRGSITLRKK
jgi:hypothetical protein